MINNLIKKACEICEENRLKIYNEKIKLISERNNNIKPTSDKNGRLHSPINNYLGLNGEIYNKGQYILSDDNCDSKLKVKDRLTRQKYILKNKETIDYFKSNIVDTIDTDKKIMFFGSTWKNDKTGQDNCYFYFYSSDNQYPYIVSELDKFVLRFKDERDVIVKLPILDGKHKLTGKIISFYKRKYGYDYINNFNIEIDGVIYTSSVPSKCENMKIGDEISFSAKFTNGSKFLKNLKIL